MTYRSPWKVSGSTPKIRCWPSSPRSRRNGPPVSLPKTSRSGTGIATAELDVTRLVETLDRHRVEYLIVGGVAAGAYGAVRPTVDFDCVVRRATQNLDRLAAVLLE